MRTARRAGAAGLGLALLLAGARTVQGDEPDPGRYPVRGIDVSHHQGEVRWAAVRQAGFRFVFLKASEGSDHQDPRFRQNWAEAGEEGLARGAYHYFSFCSDGLAQAGNFLRAHPPSPAVLPPVVDVEFVGNCRAWSSIEAIRAELGRCLRAVEDAWGRRPILYVTGEALERIVAGHFDGHPLWIRSLAGEPSSERWLFWQYSDTGRVPGVRVRVDLDVFHGDAEAFAAWVAAGSGSRPGRATREK